MTTNPYQSPDSDTFTPTSGVVAVGGAIMVLGTYVLAMFAGTALHVAKNGVGAGSMPSLGVSCRHFNEGPRRTLGELPADMF